MLSFFALLIAYLLGSIPFGYLLVRWKTGGDIRHTGSGNIGATNVFRTSGRGIGVLTLVLDALKAFVAVVIADRLCAGLPYWQHEMVINAAALAVLLGHAFPLFLNFKGGKAVASFLGAYLYLAPVAVLAVAVVFFVAVWRSKFISLGSILGAVTFPLAVWIIVRPHWPLVASSILAAALIIWRHEANLQRLRDGTERIFALGRSRG